MTNIKPKNKIQFGLTLQDSFLIKGVAICLMLWHHLFYLHPEYGRFVQYTALLSKVCVALFLFISAYGLTIQTERKNTLSKNKLLKPKNLLEFLMKRLSKLYVNYWIVFLLFVPLGVFVFNRSIIIPYGSNHTFIWLLIDFLGLADSRSYNITWWFYKLIITLYFLFPILHMALKKWTTIVLAFSMFLLVFHRISIPIIHDWLFVFVLGIYWALNKNKITIFLNKFNYIILICSSVLAILLLAFVRLASTRFGGIRIDGFFALSLIILLVITVRQQKIISRIFQFLGTHSMNIFMIHTFIFYYFYSDFIYSFKFPILIFIILLMCSLCFSMLIEYIKDKIRIHSLLDKVDQIKL